MTASQRSISAPVSKKLKTFNMELNELSWAYKLGMRGGRDSHKARMKRQAAKAERRVARAAIAEALALSTAVVG